MDVPGNVGYSLVGDESLEFVRSPRDYIKKRQQLHGAIFQARLLNKPHILLTSNAAVQELLTGRLCVHESLGVCLSHAVIVR